MTMMDWMLIGLFHSLGLVSRRPKILRRLLLNRARGKSFWNQRIQHGRE